MTRVPGLTLPTGLLAGLLGLLSGCAGLGDSPQEEYCQAVRDRQEELTEIATSEEANALLRALPVFEDLEAAAPSDVRDEWQVVTGALEGLRDAVEAAGADPSTYDAGKPPADLTVEEREDIEAAAAQLAARRTVAALAGVEQHARDVCKTPLSL